MQKEQICALGLCQFSFRYHLLSWWRSQEVDWSVNYNLDLMFCLRAHAGRQRVTINQLLTASSGSGWGLWCSWSQCRVKDNDDLRAAADETVSWSHYSVFGYLDKSGAIVRRAGSSTALDDETDTVSARSSFPASVLPTDRLFASPSPSGSLVRALGRTLSRLSWGWTSICCYRVASMILFTYIVMKYHVISYRLYWFFFVFLTFSWKKVKVLPLPSEEHSGGAVYQTNNVCGLAKVQTHSAFVGSLCFFITSGSFIIMSAINYQEKVFFCSETILHAMDWPSSLSLS